MIDVAIIGTGPYGLSLAAYLAARGVDFRIFGNPMHTWLTQMPKGMRLKSEGFASSLYDPGSTFTLGEYCRQQKLPYADVGLPVPLETFASYGLEFQKRFVPDLENKLVTSVARSQGGFQLRLEDGETTHARQVVMAIGITHYAYVPPELSALPDGLVTHSSRHHDVSKFKDREVIVVGAGASALDLAAALHKAGAHAQVVARKPVIRFHDPPVLPKPFYQKMRHPLTGIGTGWDAVFYTSAPWAFHYLPEKKRLETVRVILGPAPGWFIKEEVVGKVPLNVGLNLAKATAQNGRVSLELTDQKGNRKTMVCDHLVAATGYRVDLRRLAFLEDGTREVIRCVEHTPVLSSSFESSVPGLYFIGVSSANAFGPLMRFAFGARFTARVLSKQLVSAAVRNPVKKPSSVAAVKALDRG